MIPAQDVLARLACIQPTGQDHPLSLLGLCLEDQVTDGEEPVGIASYSFLWPAEGLTRSLYLKELYVAESAQRRGVGTALMNALFDLAAKHECSRVEWTTDTGNSGAQHFYDELGQATLPTKLFYRTSHPAQQANLGTTRGRQAGTERSG
ncbi:GNAT family N-acetyltransferase [Nonomuraea sp. NPDC052265]|uniref:GNAT family N-acetyltransferase n=1 Tax=Nonomuraea sp. NPDC052265 TaxID=3364374 RepID=UPI0037CAA498